MATELYRTAPINTKISEIRLVELLPGQGDDPISCIFHRCTLDSPALEFRALSYTWGNQKPEHVISVDNITITIRENLWLFLRQERQNKRFGLIWIDALCIDQSSVGERNHQVALMKDIYAMAIYVIIWLGPAADGSDIAVDKIRRFPSKSARKPTRLIWSYEEGDTIFTLFSRKYWKRVWIIQEILLAQDLLVCCGSSQFQWASFEQLSAELGQIDESRIHHHPHALRVKESNAMRLLSQRALWKELPPSKRHLELYELMDAHHDAECTDIRDRVFGLLSLTPRINKFSLDLALNASSPLVADYSISVRELYTQTLRYLKNSIQFSTPRPALFSHLRKCAILLQQMFKLDHIDNLVEEEIFKLTSVARTDFPARLSESRHAPMGRTPITPPKAYLDFLQNLSPTPSPPATAKTSPFHSGRSSET